MIEVMPPSRSLPWAKPGFRVTRAKARQRSVPQDRQRRAPAGGLPAKLPGDLAEAGGGRAVGARDKDGLAGVGQLGHARLERDAPEERRADLLGQPLAAAGGEQL